MEPDICSEFSKVPQNSCAATKHVMELLLHSICPVLQRIRSKFRNLTEVEAENEITTKIKSVYLLCSSQIKKCMVDFLDIIKVENIQGIYLQESRKFIFERLSWCITRLSTVEDNLSKLKIENMEEELADDPMLTTPMYFVNWIDYTFEILGKLSEEVYRTDYKNDDLLHEEWKGNMVEHTTSLHMCIDELLLSAMTICKYCLSEDQTVLRARCQVVLRETKALFAELINDDISVAVKVTKEKLKLPIMPSNVNIVIDVLKDVLYVLETNTNTALLALLIDCYVTSPSPVDVLQDHFNKRNQHFCSCRSDTGVTEVENCAVVKDFDLYNERLQQIGLFAVSCSSDQKRILTLRSCLSSLESLDPHLVPALTLSPNSHHTLLLADFWKREVKEIRDTVFLIVDPVAFVEKCKQYMRSLLLPGGPGGAGGAAGAGGLVREFFAVYQRLEPDAIAQHCEMDRLLSNVDRAHKECKAVMKYFTKSGTFLYDTRVKLDHSEVTIDTLLTRVRLLYSMVKRVHELIRPKDSDDQLFGEEEPVYNKNVTHTIRNDINTDTYTHSQRKTEPNFTRSVFARTGTKNLTKNLFLSKLTKHLQLRKGQDELNFSAQVSELFNNKETKETHCIHEGKYSLRKKLLSNQCEFPFMKKLQMSFNTQDCGEEFDRKDKQDYVLDATESLQISEILHQINDLTATIPTSKSLNNDSYSKQLDAIGDLSFKRFLEDDASSASILSNVTQPSDFTTLERINDLDLLESRLSSLRANSEFETHL